VTAALLPIATGHQVRGQLRALLHGGRARLAAAIMVMLADSAFGLAGPVAIGWIAQDVASYRGLGSVAAPAIMLAVATLAAAVTGWAGRVLLAGVVLPATASLREAVVATALGLPVDTVESGGTGDLVSRVSGDVERITDAAQDALGDFIAAGLTIAVTLAGLATLDWRFALAGLLAVPIQAHTLRWYLRTSRPIYAAGRVADGRRASALLAGFTALPTLRALCLGPSQRTRVEAASAASMEYEFAATGASTRFYGRLNLAEFTGLGAILLVAFLLVRAGLADVGAATTAALFFANLFNPINTVLAVFDSIQQAGAGLARLVGITTMVAPSPADTLDGPGAIDAREVGFGYGDGPDVLHDVTSRLAPGEHLAIVGASGSGKSTLASLLAGLRQPRDGTLTVTGTTALVTQETHLFAGTIASNLLLAAPSATPDAIIAALETAGAADWVAALPDGTATLVGAGGVALAASQAQQLALARLLLLDPDIVVLDEATAEGGSDAARALDHAASAVISGRSAVVIAHRLSQAASADTILVMDRGYIIERGSHDELLASGGTYAALWTAWSRSGTDPDPDPDPT
jgi:ABC-type multidrug transport system fused ATPase/permease subunit